MNSSDSHRIVAFVLFLPISTLGVHTSKQQIKDPKRETLWLFVVSWTSIEETKQLYIQIEKKK
jgi:hypothetical protein